MPKNSSSRRLCACVQSCIAGVYACKTHQNDTCNVDEIVLYVYHTHAKFNAQQILVILEFRLNKYSARTNAQYNMRFQMTNAVHLMHACTQFQSNFNLIK